MTERASGRVEVIAGCMFSGKTSELIRRLSAARESGARVTAIKHTGDRRSPADEIATHDGQRCAAISAAGPEELVSAALACDVLGIDEAQFFGAALVNVCAALRVAGVRVIAAGIDHDAWGRPFPPLPRLKLEADEVVVLATPCTRCGEAARFSQRMTPVVGGDMVGGIGEYEPRCGRCFEPLTLPAPVC